MNKHPSLLFVCGFPSGGTDLAKNILNAHPDVFITGEIPRLLELGSHGYNEHTQFTTAEELASAIELFQQLDHWNNLQTDNIDIDKINYPINLTSVLKLCITQTSVTIVGSKTPQFSENIRQLEKLFPKANYLYITRDVRDICLSWKRKWGKDYLLCASRWADRTVRCLDSLSELSHDKYLLISYENLVTDTESVCEDICEFLELSYSEKMPDYHKYTTDIKDGKLKYGQPIDASNASKWKASISPKLANRIEQITYDALQRTNYQATTASSRVDLTRYEKYRGLLVDLSSIILVGNRAAKNNGLISRIDAVAFEVKNSGKNEKLACKFNWRCNYSNLPVRR